MYSPLLVLLASVSFIFVQGDDILESGCIQQETCGACIKYASERCVWCPAVWTENATIKRCQTEAFSRSNSTWCAEGVENPLNNITITQEDPLSPGSSNTMKVHLTPQRIKIKARPGVPETFNISYQLSPRYPLDIYFLMDSSYSMITHSSSLKAQISEIYNTLSNGNVSTNVRMGMGSFVDKPAPPIVENHINLTDSLTSFKKQIESFSPSSLNYDIPEAGLEALMQVILCKDYLGWREEEALRIIVLFTDATYHSAGDGKIVGAFRPFDMKCHLKNNEYSRALALDYPSVGQISHIVKKEHVQVIFAIHNQVRQPYDLLARQIEGAKCTNLKDSSHIPKIILQSYMDLLRFPRLNIMSPIVKVKLDPPCSELVNTKPECRVEEKESKNISITITLEKCTDNIPPVEISVVGLSEKLRIDVEALCECDCEKLPGQEKSKMCNGFGTYQCGVCKCDEKRSGDNCFCEGERNVTDFDYNCIRPNETSRCSGRGECRCGKCENCKESNGRFCEYSDSDCPQPQLMVCGSHGRCERGRCNCHTGWQGEDCTCTESEDDCIDPYTQKVCAGFGKCNCGKCACFKSENITQYTGEFCDDCSNCTERRCKELESFVECIYNSTHTVQKKTQVDCRKMYHQRNDIDLTFGNKSEINAEEYRTFYWCSIQKTEGSIVYRHKKIYNRLGLIVQKDLDIPPKADIWIVVYTIIGVILLIGLVILITWRILVDIHDTREYNKFKDEVDELDFETAESNALYKPACTQVMNPRYRRSVYNN